MTLTEFMRGEDRVMRRYEYDDGVVVAADLGLADDAVDVDFLDGVAIVVVREGDGEQQYELELPEGDAEAFMKNGVLSIEVSR